MYLAGGTVDPTDLASRLAGDALTLGATRTLVIHQQTWFAVAADLDWLAGATIEEPFRRVLPLTKAGINSFRSEILLTAFADDVVTWDGGPMVPIKGTPTGLSPIRSSLSNSGWHRVVAFRLAPAQAPSYSQQTAATT